MAVAGEAPPDKGSVSLQTGLRREEKREKFIPVTRRALLRMLMEDEGLLTSGSEDKRLMSNVAAALDAKYSKRFYSILEQSKVSSGAKLLAYYHSRGWRGAHSDMP
jgi:hypothetical protein